MILSLWNGRICDHEQIRYALSQFRFLFRACTILWYHKKSLSSYQVKLSETRRAKKTISCDVVSERESRGLWRQVKLYKLQKVDRGSFSK